MKLNSESKFFLLVGLITVAIIAIGIALFSKPQTDVSNLPALPKEQLITDTTVTKGNKDAQHYLVEFSDFQCPACKAYQPTVDAIMEKYQDKLLFAYRHFPLDQHPFALSAAQAAVAAKQQGKFWEMYKILFENQEKFSDPTFTTEAMQIGLDMSRYQSDYEAAKDLVLKDQAYGISIGVNSTPTFYLDGKKLTLYSISDLQKQVEEILNQ